MTTSTNTPNTAVFEFPEGTTIKAIIDLTLATLRGALAHMDDDGLSDLVQHVSMAVATRSGQLYAEDKVQALDVGRLAALMPIGFLTLSAELQASALQEVGSPCGQPGCNCHYAGMGLNLVLDALRQRIARQKAKSMFEGLFKQ